MCLDTTHYRVKVAKKDITVYKTVCHTRTKKKGLAVVNGKVIEVNLIKLSPMIMNNEYYEVGKVYTSTLIYSRKAVEQGFHSFRYLNDAQACSHGSASVIECAIPKGSRYYEGYNNGSSCGYASDTLKVVKIL